MDEKLIIEKTIEFVKETLNEAESGHDWWHVYRVWNLSKLIAKDEKNVNLFIVELGALLHDIADSKFHNGDEELGPKKARNFLLSLNVNENIINEIELIISRSSFKENYNGQKSIEFKIIQDADKLDSLGAIGIARAFNFGGYFNRRIHNPNIQPNLNLSKDEYKKRESTSINHFYEKLLNLKDLMNTKKGKELAFKRHKFMEDYLNHFFDEWNLNN